MARLIDGKAVWRNVASPAYLATMAALTVALWATDRYTPATGKWAWTRNLRFSAMGALGAGIGFGILAPMFPPLGLGVKGAAAAASTAAMATEPAPPMNRATSAKQFEPAQGIESSGVFVGQ